MRPTINMEVIRLYMRATPLKDLPDIVKNVIQRHADMWFVKNQAALLEAKEAIEMEIAEKQSMLTEYQAKISSLTPDVVKE